MRKTKLSFVLVGSAALLAGCANNPISGLALQQTDNPNQRDKVILSAEVLHGNEEEGFEKVAGSARVFEDQADFSNNSFDFGAETAHYELTMDEGQSVAGHTITITVKAENPEDTAKCEIKVTGITEPLHSNEAEGRGSATCIATFA